MKIETTVTTRVYGLVLAYPGITAREINSTLRETCEIDNTSAVNAAIQHLKKKGAIVSVAGISARSTMYYQGEVPAMFRSPAGQHRKNVNKAVSLVNQRAVAIQQYNAFSAELAALAEKMKALP